MKSVITVFFITALIAGCTTVTPLTYRPSNTGEPGYYESQRGVYKWMVGAYYVLGQHAPQQAANLVMRRAAEIASQNGFKWMRILDYDKEQRYGSIGGLPASISLNKAGYGTLYPGRNFYGNQDAIHHRTSHMAVVEYIEFSRKIDCQTDHCPEPAFFLEKCNEGWDGGAKEFVSRCEESTKLENAGLVEACIDRIRYITKDFCSTMNFAASKVRGLVEERKIGEIGGWYKTDEILKKYSTRIEEWAAK